MNAKSGCRLPWRGLLAALPHFAFAGAFLVVWIHPLHYGDKTVSRFMMVMLLEFFVVHSTGFLNAVAFSGDSLLRRAAMFLGLLAFYVLMVGGISLGFGTFSPLLAFLALMVSKFPAAVVQRHPGEGMSFAMTQWAAMVVCYLAAVFAGVILPLPTLGVTPDVIALQQFEGSGAWLEAPQTVLASGFIYFTLLGIFEIIMDACSNLLGRLQNRSSGANPAA